MDLYRKCRLIEVLRSLPVTKYQRYSERPNTTGIAAHTFYLNAQDDFEGVFKRTDTSVENWGFNAGTIGRIWTRLRFNLSDGNSIYKNISTVQPEGIYGLLLLKAY